ncbi:MAG: 4Fe-4S dicluster domain-containing protein [Candidatus Omnitrophota bacterium]|nr:MAG: 4Fe-4S dicluster domain-containing protein [Candidatus Omnitrophota bacterium]
MAQYKPKKKNVFTSNSHSTSHSLLYMVKIKKNKCKGCQFCIFYCPTKHLELSKDLNRRGVMYAEVKKYSRCVGCGFCFTVCPESCIEVYGAKNKGKK